MFDCLSYVRPIATARALFQALESIEPGAAVKYARLQSEIWEIFECFIFNDNVVYNRSSGWLLITPKFTVTDSHDRKKAMACGVTSGRLEEQQVFRDL